MQFSLENLKVFSDLFLQISGNTFVKKKITVRVNIGIKKFIRMN